MDVIDPSLAHIPPSNFEHGPQGEPYPQVPNPYYQPPAVPFHVPTSYYSAHLYETHSHEDHPGCPTSLDCLPSAQGLEKPTQTLPILVRAAILGSPLQRLTIRDIYAAIELRFPYFKTAKENWKGSIRHNLSLNNMFTQAPRPETEPGLGAYWTVDMEVPLSKRTPRKRPPGLSSPSPSPMPVEEAPIAGSSSAVTADPVPEEAPAPSSSIRGRKRGRGRGGAAAPAPTRRVPARAASSRKRSYAELAGEENAFDDYEPKEEEEGEDEDELLSKTRDMDNESTATTRKRGRPRKNYSSAGSRPAPSSDEGVIATLIEELAETQRQHRIATALSLRLADQLTDVQADNTRERAAIRRAVENTEQERRAQGAATRRLMQLQKRAAVLDAWRLGIESGGVPQGEHIESSGETEGDGGAELDGGGTYRVEVDTDVISQAMSSEPMVMSGEDFGALVGGL